MTTQARFSQRKNQPGTGTYHLLQKWDYSISWTNSIIRLRGLMGFQHTLRLRLAQECLPILSISLLYHDSGRWISSIMWLKYLYLSLHRTFALYLLFQF